MAEAKKKSPRKPRAEHPPGTDAPKPRRTRAPAKTPASVLALADDARVTDVLVVAELGALTPARRRQVIAAWTERVAAGEQALATRLLGMFEVTAMTCKDPDELQPFIEPLREVGGLPEVFSHLEAAFASERSAVLEAVCGHWLGDARAQRVFDDLQIDKLVRCMVAIAEGPDDGPDRRAATAALRGSVHPGARDALMDAIRHARADGNPELRAALYTGLVANRGRHLVPFLTERLFVERAEYGALVASLGRVLDDSAQRYIMAALAARAKDPGAIHAATLYADTLARAKAKPQLLDLARAVHAWQPATNDDARRLRHVLELGLAGALALGRGDEVRALYARARQLPDSPYSDYHVLARDARTPALLDVPLIRKQLATLDA